MRNRFNQRQDTMSWFFDRVFPKLFIGMFVFAALIILIQVAIIGFAGYKIVSDPEGTAKTVGTIAAEAIKPVVDAVKEEK